MKISNFVLTEVIGSDAIDWKFRATVDVTTRVGFFLWKEKVEKRDIYKTFAGSWHFVDSGKFTDGNTADELARSLEAKTGKRLAYCLKT